MNKKSNNSKWLLLCIALIGLTYDVYIICTFNLLLIAEKCVIYTSLVGFCLQLLMLLFDKRLNLAIFIHTVVFVIAYYVIRQEYWWYLIKYNRNSMYYVLIAISLMILIVSVGEEKLKKGERRKNIYSYIYIIALSITCMVCIYPFYEKVDVKRMDKYYEMDFLLTSTDNSVIFVDKGSPVVYGMSETEKKFIESWEDIIKVEAYGNDVYGLSETGEIFYYGENKKIKNEVKKWKNIRDIAAGDGYILALSDGLMAAGDKTSYECAYEEIKKIDAEMIKQIETVGSDIILLKSDGTVSTYGKITKYYFDSEQWQDIR